MNTFKQSILKSISILFSFTLLSRFFGFLRETAVASYLGNTAVGDAYSIAYNIPTIIVELLAFGSIGSAAMAIFQKLKSENFEKFENLYNNLFSHILIILIISILICYLFCPQLVFIFAPRFSNEKLILTEYMTKRMIVGILFLGLVGLQMALLHCFNDFKTGGYANVFFNICLVLGAIVAQLYSNIDILLYSFLFAAIVRFICLIKGVRNTGIRIKPYLNSCDGDLLEIIKLMGLTLIASLTTFLTPAVAKAIASEYNDGIVAALNYSYKLVRLPVGIISSAIVAASFPKISKLVVENSDNLNTFINSIFRIIVTLSLPITLIFSFANKSIVSFVFQRNAFKFEDTILTSKLLLGFAPTIIFSGLVMYLSNIYYAQKRNHIPLFINIFSLLIGSVLSYYIGRNIDSQYMSFGFSIGSIVNTILLVIFIKNLEIKPFKLSIQDIIYILAIIILSYFSITYFDHIYFSLLFELSFYIRSLLIVVLIITYIGCYVFIFWKKNILSFNCDIKLIRQREF